MFQRYLQVCNSQQYFHPIYQRCEDCHPRCKGCTEYKQCKDCQKMPGNFTRYDQLADGFCDSCPDGQTWKPDNICNGCSVSCNCDKNNKQCISCKHSQNKLNSEKNTCEPCKEDEGYYIDGQYCKKCNIICKTCQGSSENDCKDCIDGAKKYQDGSCKYNKQNPSDCLSPYILDKNQNCVLCDQDGYYAKDKNCVECQVNLKCQKCSPETQCTKCYDNKPEKYLQDGKKCTDCKQNGYFINSSSNTCDKCISNCDQCDNNFQCKQCSSGFYVLEDDKSCSQCITDGYYIDKTNKYCNQCPPEKKCKKCNNNNLKCTQCLSGFYLLNSDSCIICGGGYFKSGNNCFKCIDNCQTCTNDKKCIKCLPNFYLYNDGAQCVPCDNLGQFQQNDTCQSCHISCSKCKGKTENDCLECKEINQFNYKGKCEVCTRDGVFQREKQCLDCAQNCKFCTGIEEEKCSQCVDGYNFMQDKKCGICPTDKNFFIDINGNCKKCHESCKTCINEKLCQSCEQGKYIQSDGRCDNCEQGFYIENKYCRQCKVGCSSCISYFNCEQCQPLFYKMR
ncbi:hypothetical protein ABPG74_012034 [Tetrahymena malaccensis]